KNGQTFNLYFAYDGVIDLTVIIDQFAEHQAGSAHEISLYPGVDEEVVFLRSEALKTNSEKIVRLNLIIEGREVVLPYDAVLGKVFLVHIALLKEHCLFVCNTGTESGKDTYKKEY